MKFEITIFQNNNTNNTYEALKYNVEENCFLMEMIDGLIIIPLNSVYHIAIQNIKEEEEDEQN